MVGAPVSITWVPGLGDWETTRLAGKPPTEPLTFQPKPPSSTIPEANTNSWPRTSGTTMTCRCGAVCSAGLRAAGLSAARLIVALKSRTTAAMAATRGIVRIRPDTARESEALVIFVTPLMGEVDDVRREGWATGARLEALE